jgi:hypothetical protein
MNPSRNGDARGPLKSESAEDLSHASSERYSPQSTHSKTSGVLVMIGVVMVAVAAAAVWLMMSP